MRISQHVSFSLRSAGVTAAEITAALLLEPDETWVMGSRDPVHVIPRCHGWSVSTTTRNRPINAQLDEVVARLRPAVPQIRTLVRGGVGATLWVVRTFDGDEGVEDEGTPPDLAALGIEKVGGQHHLLGWRLDPTVLDFLHQTGAELDVDEYG